MAVAVRAEEAVATAEVAPASRGKAGSSGVSSGVKLEHVGRPRPLPRLIPAPLRALAACAAGPDTLLSSCLSPGLRPARLR